MIGYIYKITNKLNGKAYIGKTINSIEERWKEHQKEVKRSPNRPLYRAINKYGIENFLIECVEKIDTKLLNEREIYWIKYYHTYSEGYNATLGGEGTSKYDYDEIEKLIRSQKTTKEIVDLIGCCEDTVQLVARKNNLIINGKRGFRKPNQPVEQYSLQGEFLRNFESYSEAAQWLEKQGIVCGHLNGVRSHISDVCKGKRKTAYKFIWKDKFI